MPRTSTFALTNATLPYVSELARRGPAKALTESDALWSAANVIAGCVTHDAVAEAFGMDFTPAREAASRIA